MPARLPEPHAAAPALGCSPSVLPYLHFNASSATFLRLQPKKKSWGISAEATTYAPGGPTSMGDELESVKRAKNQGPDAI